MKEISRRISRVIVIRFISPPSMEGTKPNRASLREEDVLLLFNRYSITTILNLLKEVAHCASSPQLDWDALVRESSTGISSAREYQMLWRHIAYQTPLLEKLESGAEPLDDDSDLDFELEASPPVNIETLAEAAASVRILISSGSVHEQGVSRLSGELLSASNASNGLAQQAAASVEGADGNGVAGPAKKKRKLWTKEEDLELIAAVDKCGEGNWANILKGDFKHNRTASQLSQRWSIIRKKRASLNLGNGSNIPSSTTTEAHMATWQAVNMAIKMPITGSLVTRRPGPAGATQPADPSTPSSSTPSPATMPEPVAGIPSSEAAPSQPPQPISLTLTSPKPIVSVNAKPRTNAKASGVTAKPLPGPSSMIQAAAIAAGGRIAPPSTAASHFKAAQSKNAVHIRPGGPILSKSGPSTSTSRGPKAPVSPKEAGVTTNVSKLSSQPTPATGNDSGDMDVEADDVSKVESMGDSKMGPKTSESTNLAPDGAGNGDGLRSEDTQTGKLEREKETVKLESKPTGDEDPETRKSTVVCLSVEGGEGSEMDVFLKGKSLTSADGEVER
ncbi:uncharacterized protein LOC144704670 [Wolffia australiana]